MEHYDRTLTIRPGSFWGHYRAAAACFGLGRTAEAAAHLTRCLDRRPGNAAIRMQLASCLIAMKQYPGALELCDRALDRAPSYAETYRTRAYARAGSGQIGGLDDDIWHFEMFSRILPRPYWGDAEAVDLLKTAGAASTAGPGMAGIWAVLPRSGDRGLVGEIGPEEVEPRSSLADALRRAGLFPLAEVELEKILVIQPDHIPTRMMRAEQSLELGRFADARAELDVVLDHPGLEDYVRGTSKSLDPFFLITRLYLRAGKANEARRVAERAGTWRSGSNALPARPTTTWPESTRCSARPTPISSMRRPSSSSGPSSPIRTSSGDTGMTCAVPARGGPATTTTSAGSARCGPASMKRSRGWRTPRRPVAASSPAGPGPGPGTRGVNADQSPGSSDSQSSRNWYSGWDGCCLASAGMASRAASRVAKKADPSMFFTNPTLDSNSSVP